jgi:hypothetical protein
MSVASADHGRAGPGVEARGTEVRRPLRVAQLVGQPLVLALPDGRQILPLGPACRGLVQIDGDGQFAADALAHAPRDGRAVLHGHAGDRDEGADVSGPHPRVRAVVLGHVDDLGGLGDGLEGPLGHGVRVAHERHHGAVRVRPGVHVQHGHARDGLDGVRDLLELRPVSPLGEVGDTLHHALVHERTPSSRIV